MGFATTSDNPWVKLDKQSVIGMLKGTGSKDADVLHSQKQKLLNTTKKTKMYAILSIVVGIGSSLTLILAIFGIPLALFGWWALRRSAQNRQTVEEAWTDYLSAVNA